jgi:hypothetical protein
VILQVYQMGQEHSPRRDAVIKQRFPNSIFLAL